jgi:hypothetical protein
MPSDVLSEINSQSSVLDRLNNLSVIDELNNPPDLFAQLNAPQQSYEAGDTPTGPTGPSGPTGPVVPLVPICFVSGSNVVTDQGIIEIQNINKSIHTIRNKKIVALTKTKLFTKHLDYLVEIEKSSFYKNVPNKRTTMSPNHKIFYSGKMVCAKELVGEVEGVNKIPYNDEILYNILLETHDKMIVNNLISETLHPYNIVGILYNSTLPEKEKDKIIIKINKATINKDGDRYLSLGKKLINK